ncbi:E3 ubiquitin/ISG15 ligase TRIM25 isoform X1 [Harpia harpyja]|uniref:E3 ubiquitin/ISG15 ligase TRIM25 isoform X1 n=1 Tax=Harpia harpyja TaxID=202280 RepID=UPI0022B17E0C|nr:E3 ubiquitin/ISG15 ligase TRIM25 isoform X1 [Harpia harpyja]
MAALARSPSEPSLVALEEELTCSICLCLFSSPVTVPCGHNFCASCLELCWAGLSANFSCPQCRATFAGRPKLQKNTVLCRVVEQLQGRAGLGAQEEEEEEEEAAGRGAQAPPVCCDSCLQAPAVQTCLTCTASFCAEHLRPHRDSPAFRDHQLCPPLRDLQQRKCPQHNKLFEFFCGQHGTCICSLCLLGHKLCPTSPLQVAKANAQLVLKKRLVELHNQSERATQAMNTVKTNQSQAAETASEKKDLIKNEFLEIKVLIEERETQTLKAIADEEKRVSNKFDYIYGVLGSKKKEIQSLRDQIEMALTEGDDILFLKRAAALQQTPTKDAFVPLIEMDQNLLHSTYQSAVNLKDVVKLSVIQCREKRVEAKLTPGKTKTPPAASSNRTFVGKKPPGPQHTHKEKILHQAQATLQVEADTKEKKKPVKVAPTMGTLNAAAVVSTKELIDSFLKKSREELLQYAANITLDYNTAHNKVILSERYTRMSVSDIPQNYNHHPQRFIDCFQVLGFQCFKRGIHYWEVELQQNNFCGIGICYGSMDRQGPESRLGRNSSSWCIEWFNSKISSWHNDVEKCLPNVKATKIGVLLHCEGGFVIFMAVGEKHNLIYKFKTQFTEALYPAFWLFSSGTVLSLCQMKQ